MRNLVVILLLTDEKASEKKHVKKVNGRRNRRSHSIILYTWYHFLVSPLFFYVDEILSFFSYNLQVNLMHFFVNNNQVLNTQKIDRSAIAQNQIIIIISNNQNFARIFTPIPWFSRETASLGFKRSKQTCDKFKNETFW